MVDNVDEFPPLPYFVNKDMLLMEKTMKGFQLESTNVFRWYSVKLNLLGTVNYDPTLR